jgi:hypothetical protein
MNRPVHSVVMTALLPAAVDAAGGGTGAFDDISGHDEASDNPYDPSMIRCCDVLAR